MQKVYVVCGLSHQLWQGLCLVLRVTVSTCRRGNPLPLKQKVANSFLIIFPKYHACKKSAQRVMVAALSHELMTVKSELGTANLHSIPQPQNCKRCSATANPQVCDRFAVTFRTSANLDHIIYCYFVFVMTFFIFEGQILPSTRR